MLYAFSGAHPYSIFVLKLMGIEIRLLLDHLADAEPATKTAATAAATPAAAAAAESAATATAAATAADATTSSAAPPASHSEPVADVDDDTDADVLSLFIACFENSMEVDIALTREVVRMLLQERCALRAADSFLAAYFTQDNGAEWSDDVALYLDSVCVSDPRWLAAISMRSNGIGGVRRRAAVGGGGVDDDDEIDDDDAALRDAVVADLEYLHGTVERLRPAAVRENRDELCAYFLCGGRGEGGAALPHFAALRAGDATVAHNAPLQKAMQERAQWLRDVYEAFRVYDDLTAACGLQCAAVALAEERRVRGDAGAAATAVAGDVASARLEPWLRDAVREFMGRATREEIGDSMWSRLQTLLRSFSE